MVYQVLINFNDKKNKPLAVADSEKEFLQTTVRELKQKFLAKFHETFDPDDIRVIFGKDPLEDHQTLGFYKIKHLSVLLIVMIMRAGGGPPEPGGNEYWSRVRETAGLLDRLRIGAGRQRMAESPSVPQHEAATKPRLITNQSYSDPKRHASHDDRKQQSEGKVDHLPVEAAAPQSDPDLQFLLSLLPALKRMDVRHREFTKLAIHQLLYELEFNYPNPPHEGMRRTDSKEYLPPKM